jgi:hypothetical protein
MIRARQRFGRLEVLSGPIERDAHGHRFRRCRCVACGQIVRVRDDALVAGRTRSCGCLRAELARERAKGSRDAG